MVDTNHFQMQKKKKKKKEQKSFWFDPYMVEHTHITFEHAQTHK